MIDMIEVITKSTAPSFNIKHLSPKYFIAGAISSYFEKIPKPGTRYYCHKIYDSKNNNIITYLKFDYCMEIKKFLDELRK